MPILRSHEGAEPRAPSAQRGAYGEAGRRVGQPEQLREGLGISQEELSSVMDVQQPAISKLVRRPDMRVSTLRGLIAVMGESYISPLRSGASWEAIGRIECTLMERLPDWEDSNASFDRLCPLWITIYRIHFIQQIGKRARRHVCAALCSSGYIDYRPYLADCLQKGI